MKEPLSDCIVYRELVQRSPEWYALRWITASNFGPLLDHHMEKRFFQTVRMISGVCPQPGDARQDEQTAREMMDRGIREEPLIRDAYVQRMGTPVVEVGFMKSNSLPLVGASPDGIVLKPGSVATVDGWRPSDILGCIEIKSAHHMYNGLREYIRQMKREHLERAKQSNGGDIGETLWRMFSNTQSNEVVFVDRNPELNPNFNRDLLYPHILRNHFDQMQGVMHVGDLPWCDYIVHCSSENITYQTRVYRNERYFHEVMEPNLLQAAGMLHDWLVADAVATVYRHPEEFGINA